MVRSSIAWPTVFVVCSSSSALPVTVTESVAAPTSSARRRFNTSSTRSTIPERASFLKPGAETSIVKLFWAALTQRLHQLALEVEGPYAALVAGSRHVVDDGRWQQAFLWSRVGAIAGGTSEVQANIIAQRLLGLPR